MIQGKNSKGLLMYNKWIDFQYIALTNENEAILI